MASNKKKEAREANPALRFGRARYHVTSIGKRRYSRLDRNLNPPLHVADLSWDCFFDVDPRLELMITGASLYLPNGWEVSLGEQVVDNPNWNRSTAQNNGSAGLLRQKRKTKNHSNGRAIDISIITNEGVILSNIRNFRSFRVYELFAQIVAKLIIENKILQDYDTVEEGTADDIMPRYTASPVDWSDLRTFPGEKIPVGKKGHRRNFDENGNEIFEISNDNTEKTGKKIRYSLNRKEKDLLDPEKSVQLSPPAENIGFRWGGYFSVTNFYKTEEEVPPPVWESKLNKQTGEIEKVCVSQANIIYYDSAEYVFKKRAVKKLTTLSDGSINEFTYPEESNVPFDCMHFDFSEGGAGYSFASGLGADAKALLTIPGNFTDNGEPIVPVSIPVKNWAEFQLPQTPEESKQRFEEALGQSPIGQNLVSSTPYIPSLEVEARSVPLYSPVPEQGQQISLEPISEYWIPDVPITKAGTNIPPRKSNKRSIPDGRRVDQY